MQTQEASLGILTSSFRATKATESASLTMVACDVSSLRPLLQVMQSLSLKNLKALVLFANHNYLNESSSEDMSS